jgi:alkylhydroperoxidase/carboxymuconolactone decarboxylase family protein YurZ
MKHASSGGIQEFHMKFFAATITTAVLLASSVAQVQELKMKEDMRVVAPALEKYAQDRLLGEVWRRPDLSARDRSIVTLTALIARSQTIELPFYLNLALDTGVQPAENFRDHYASCVLFRMCERRVGGLGHEGCVRRAQDWG